MRRMQIAFLLVLLILSRGASGADKVHAHQNNIRTVNNAFVPGEKLTYSISWSKVLNAGIAVMEIAEARTPSGKLAYRFVSRTRSVGMVDAVFPVNDLVQSLTDAEEMKSLHFHLKESHGPRKRERELHFDWAAMTVRARLNNDPVQTFPVHGRMHDALSSVYYVRTRNDFVVGKPIIVDIHDSSKNWAVEVHTLGRERIKTPVGEFDTILVKTYPKYEGVFMHKGEIFMWITDDARKIPVLMKSKITIGSIVATLIEMQGEIKIP